MNITEGRMPFAKLQLADIDFENPRTPIAVDSHVDARVALAANLFPRLERDAPRFSSDAGRQIRGALRN